MKILLDEMYTGMKEHLQILGWNVVTVEDTEMKGKKDKNIVEYARGNDMLVVTRDSKVAELAGLAKVRFVLISNSIIAQIVSDKIKENYPDLK